MVKGIKSRLEVKLVSIDNEVIMDEELASLLFLIKKEGSLLRASKKLGMTYSRAWDKISRTEKILGIKLLLSKRGVRGGASLTKEALKLLSTYLYEYERFTGRKFKIYSEDLTTMKSLEGLIVAGSHDIALAYLISDLKEKGSLIEAYWIGSLNGIASIMLREGDIAGVHLIDEDNNLYNITYFKKLDLASIANLVKGYERVLGFVSKEKSNLESILNGLVSGELKLVNRQVGSGTRKVLEWLLKDYAKSKGYNYNKLKRKIRGYKFEVNTHVDVGNSIVNGEADVGLAIKQIANAFALNFVPVIWESFDFVIAKRSFKKSITKEFLDELKVRIPKIAKRLEGYRIPEDIGKILI